MKRLRWVALALVAALLIAVLASPRSVAGIALRRAAQALGSFFAAPADPADGERPVDVLPGQRVPATPYHWE